MNQLIEQPFTHRELERLLAGVDRLTAVLDELPERLREENAKTYVRQDVYVADRKADATEILGLTKTVDGHSKIVAWISYTIIGAVLLALLGVVLVQSGGLP